MVNAMKTLTAGLLAATVLAPTAETKADAIAVDKPLICAVTEVAQCSEAGRCAKGPAGLFNLPIFFRVDFGANTVETLREGGERRTSAIDGVDETNGAVSFRGNDDGTPWLTRIQLASGHMTTAAATDDSGYLIFGACTPL